jgi:predicted lipoprotein with Yx(FWY)xxD motif
MRALCGAAAMCALAACGGGDKAGNGGGNAGPDSTAKSAIAPDTTSAANEQKQGLKPLDTTAAAVQAGPMFTVSRTAELGEYLADRAGRPLYVFSNDQNGQSACYDACAQTWKPVTAVQGTPAAGSAGVQPSLLGTTKRRDGTDQVTYNRHPLYYYQRDQGASAPAGNDVKDAGGEWYLVSPQGEKVEGHGAHAGDKS